MSMQRVRRLRILSEHCLTPDDDPLPLSRDVCRGSDEVFEFVAFHRCRFGGA